MRLCRYKFILRYIKFEFQREAQVKKMNVSSRTNLVHGWIDEKVYKILIPDGFCKIACFFWYRIVHINMVVNHTKMFKNFSIFFWMRESRSAKKIFQLRALHLYEDKEVSFQRQSLFAEHKIFYLILTILFNMYISFEIFLNSFKYLKL